MINPKIILLLLVTVFTACSQSSSINDQQKKTIDIFGSIGNEKSISISEIAESIEYIPLETSENSVISSPTDIILANNLIYIKGKPTEPIMIFDKSGKFINSIDKIGRSNEEYESIISIAVDKNGNLCIESSQKISEYKPDGTFIRNIFKDKNVRYRGFAKLNDNLYILSSALGINFTSSYSAIDSASRVLWNTSFTNDEKEVLKIFTRADMFKQPYRFKDKVMISGGIWDYILSVNENLEIDTAFYFNYGNFKLTEDNVKELANTKNLITRQSDILESDKYIFLKYNIGNLAKTEVIAQPLEGAGKQLKLPWLHLFFDKQTGSTTSLRQDAANQLGFIDDINRGEAIWPVSISEDNYMTSFIPAHKFKETFANKEGKSKYAQYAKQISDNDNPVVVVVKLKK